MTPHRLLGAVGALLLALVAAAIAYWFVAAEALRKGLDQWAIARGAEGYQVSYGQPLLGGFPLDIRLVVADPLIAAPATGPSGAWSWHGTALQIETRLWNPRTVTFSLPGRHEFTKAGLAQPIVARAEAAVGWAAIGHDGRVLEATIDATKLDLDFAGRIGHVAAGRAVFWVRPRPRSADPDEPLPPLETTVTMRELTLPATLDGPLGREVPLVTADVTVNGKLPQSATRAGLAAWRDQSGTIEVLEFKLRWGPLNLKGSGTVTIDEDMRPLGAATVEVRGFNETVQRLMEAGAVKKQAGTTAQLILGVLAKPAKPGGEPVLTVPLTAQDGFLSLGPVRLLPVPPLALD
jgi:hypothetical protein